MLREILHSGQTTVLFESPNRLLKTLHSIRHICGEEQNVFVGLELTKFHEAHFRGLISKVFDELELQNEDLKIKGEVTMVLAPPKMEKH